MTSLGQAFVEVRAKVDTGAVSRDISQGLSGPVAKGAQAGERSVHAATLGMTRSFASLGGAVAGALAGRALIGGFKSLISAAQESALVTAQTAAVIKSTGGAAGLSVTQIGNYANQLAALTGIDDEVIQSGENMLLTFTNVRNGLGKGNDIFNQATKTVLDMSTALGQDTKSSAIQLGKALNDPIKGVTALQRVGVTFTESQKAQIKTLVDSGRTMDAQKVILRELGKEFGGSAAAAATPMAKLHVVIGNLAESLGGHLLPIVNRLATFFLSTVIPAVGKAGAAFHLLFGGGGDEAQGFGEIMDNVFGNSGRLVGFFRATGGAILGLVAGFRSLISFSVANVLPNLARLGAFISGTLIPAFQKAAAFIGGQAVAAFRFIADAVQKNRPQLEALLAGLGRVASFVGRVLGPALVLVLGAALRVVGTAIGIAIATIGTLVRVFATMYKAAQTAGRFISTAFDAIKGAGTVMWDVLKAAFRGIVDAFLLAGSTIIHGAASMFGWVPGVGGKLKDAAAKFDIFRDNVNSALAGAAADGLIGGGSIGDNIGAGLYNGLASQQQRVLALAGGLGAAAANAVRHGAQVFSPSRATFYVGEMLSEGLAQGINSRAFAPEQASTNMINRAFAAARDATFLTPGLGGAAVGSGSQSRATYNYTANVTNHQAVVPEEQLRRTFNLMRLKHA